MPPLRGKKMPRKKAAPAPAFPKRLKVGYQNYKIFVHESNLAGGSYGHTDTRVAEITFNGRMIVRQSCNTLIHEALHAIWEAQGLPGNHPEEERFVTALANGLTQVMADNPNFTEWLRHALRRTN